MGCGCAYPDCTPDDSVARSNRIHKMLSFALDGAPGLKATLLDRPSLLVASVAGKRIGVTHGDEKRLADGITPASPCKTSCVQDEVDTFMAENDLDVFTTTHTCAPAAIKLARGVVVNNGARRPSQLRRRTLWSLHSHCRTAARGLPLRMRVRRPLRPGDSRALRP